METLPECPQQTTGPAPCTETGTAVPLLSIIVPIYNEVKMLTEILRQVRAVDLPKEILFVDDGSTDGTREKLRAEVEGRYPDVIVLYHDRNRGKGAAIRTAISRCVGEYILIQDADLEYDPQDYLVLLKPAREQGAAVVYGSRFLRQRPPMRLPNRIVNWLLAAMVRVFYGAPMTDEATCYKLFRRDILQGIPLECQRFEFCPEVTAKALRRGHKIVEVPIHYHPRTHAEGKKIRWTDGISAIWTLLRYRFWRG